MQNIFTKFTKEEELTVNITSMIDVIFILLIFFMVSTQFKKNSLPLNLPQTEESVKTEQDAVHTLAVNGEQLEYDGNQIEINQLEELLKNQFNADPDMSVSLECEKSVEFERVVQILTKIQNSGISKIGIVHETLD